MGQKNRVGGYEFVKEIFSYLPKPTPKLESFGFPGGQPDTDRDRLLAKSYSTSLATLCVTYNEPFGLKALESMACGTPVLAVAEGGYKESVIDNKTGWLLPRDPQVFAKKITHLVKHPDVSQNMGQVARDHVIKNWTWKRHVNQLEKILYHTSQS